MYVYTHTLFKCACVHMCVYMGETAHISESALAGLHLGRHKAQREWSLVSEFLSCH